MIIYKYLTKQNPFAPTKGETHQQSFPNMKRLWNKTCAKVVLREVSLTPKWLDNCMREKTSFSTCHKHYFSVRGHRRIKTKEARRTTALSLQSTRGTREESRLPDPGGWDYQKKRNSKHFVTNTPRRLPRGRVRLHVPKGQALQVPALEKLTDPARKNMNTTPGSQVYGRFQCRMEEPRGVKVNSARGRTWATWAEGSRVVPQRWLARTHGAWGGGEKGLEKEPHAD